MAAAASPGDGPNVVIFLDIDGVMNTKSSRKLKFSDATGGLVLNDLPPKELCDNLQSLVRSTGCQIVLSSTWRLEPRKVAELEPLFAEYGLAISGSTPDLEKACKGDRVDEIMLWLQEADGDAPSAWVAIDDLDLLKMNTRLSEANFVRTSDLQGLSKEKVAEALEKLAAQSQSVPERA